MAIFLARAFKLTVESRSGFKDVSPNMAAYSSIKKIVEKKITLTYGVNNQQEYDAVMKVVDATIAQYKGKTIFGDKYHDYYINFLNGERHSGDRSDRSDREMGLHSAEQSIGKLVEAGLSQSEIERAVEATKIAVNAIGGSMVGKNGTPRSAYESLVVKVSDCDADAKI